MRESGILLPVASLPSRYGIGCFSKESYEFVAYLRTAGQKKWQILPMGPTGYGDSPYQSFSTFAGNPYFIDLETLQDWGLLTEEECKNQDFGALEGDIDYEKMYHSRFQVLRIAFVRFQKDKREGNISKESFQKFKSENAYWLEDYSLYMALKNRFGGKGWSEWDMPYRNREKEALEAVREELAEEIQFYAFQQYLFWVQWNALHAFAKEQGVEIIGDIPIYVAFDSADTWASPELFQFTEERQPKAVAGCPPDPFAPTGQLWGNPLYDWEYHKKTGFEWWMKRLAYCFRLYDVLRLDHFRGFDEYYSIPATDRTAEHGHWEKGPGMEFFTKLKEVLGEVRIIAEDLGFLTDSVRELVAETGYPGMKILQFAFDSRETSNYLPCYYEQNCVVYTGTHDNDTLKGWYEVLDEQDRKLALDYMNGYGKSDQELHWEFIRLAMASVGNLCIIPMQDYLELGTKARINQPGTVGGNWRWRLLDEQLTEELAQRIFEMTKVYGRIPEDKIE